MPAGVPAVPRASVLAFSLAHFSDAHLNPLPRLRARELLNKRATGYLNWLRSRRRVHDMATLQLVVADMLASHPDHIACTGDLTHLGLRGEFDNAAAFLTGLGPRETVSFVPGNHDAYLKRDTASLTAAFKPWASSDDGAEGYPWLKVRGPLALIGINSGIPTPVFMAWGRAGQEQLDKAEALLHYADKLGLTRVVLIHHPPHAGGTKPGRDLTDAPNFEAMLARAGADLVIHGHNHKASLAWLPTPAGHAPVVGVASASMRDHEGNERASWHRFQFEQGQPIRLERRGETEDGVIGLISEMALVRAG
jgi:3',5'-cyclic AMP phosphodiesterase CpdA